MADEQRRWDEDQNRQLSERLDKLERQQDQTRVAVGTLESSIKMMEREQVHLRELMDARLQMLADSNKLNGLKLDNLGELIAKQASDPQLSPAGRELFSKIQDVERMCIGHDEKATEIEKKLDARIVESDKKLADHERWKNRVDGILSLVQFLGWAGLGGLLLAVLRMARVIP